MSGNWIVERWSGRSADQYKTTLETNDEGKARAIYLIEAEKMRQGGVRLRNPTGVLIEGCFAPRLRSRW